MAPRWNFWEINMATPTIERKTIWKGNAIRDNKDYFRRTGDIDHIKRKNIQGITT